MSEQADKAIEKKRQAVRSILGLYGRIARHYCPANSVVDAGVAILDELIRSHTAPSSDLAGAAKEFQRAVFDYFHDSNGDSAEQMTRIENADKALRSALSAKEPKVCNFRFDGYDHSIRDCGYKHHLVEDDHSDPSKFCPGCGRPNGIELNPIEVKEG